MKRSVSIFVLAFGLSTSASGAPKAFTLSLTAAESAGIRTSNVVRSADSSVSSAKDQADAQWAVLLPRLTLDGHYQYQTIVPSLTLPGPPHAPPQTLTFGANSSYSIGPTLSYTLWDGGASRNAYKSAETISGAQEASRQNTTDQVLRSTRTAYVRVQLAVEELRETASSVKTVEVQDDDIVKRFHAGSASELDRLTSRRQVLNYLLQFKQRQADLAQALEDLVDLTGQQNQFDIADTRSPYAPEILSLGVTDVEEPTLLVQVDRLNDTLNRYTGRSWPAPSENHPLLREERLTAEAQQLSADSTDGALWPTIQLSARTSLDYPNGPVLERINQNSFLATLSMPLWEWDRTRKIVDSKRAIADADTFQHDQSAIDLDRDWRKGTAQLESLRTQLTFAQEAVVAAEKEQRLSYDTYKAGRMSLVDLQSANFRALDAKVGAARIEAQTLFQIIDLAALSGDKTIKTTGESNVQ